MTTPSKMPSRRWRKKGSLPSCRRSGTLNGDQAAESKLHGLGALSLAVSPIEYFRRNLRLKRLAAAEFLRSSSPSLRAVSRGSRATWFSMTRAPRQTRAGLLALGRALQLLQRRNTGGKDQLTERGGSLVLHQGVRVVQHDVRKNRHGLLSTELSQNRFRMYPQDKTWLVSYKFCTRLAFRSNFTE